MIARINKTTLASLIALSGIAITGCSTPGGTALDTTEQQQSYAVGYQLSEQLLSQMGPVDTDAFLAGIRAQMEGDTSLPLEHSAMEDLVQTYQTTQNERREAQAAAEARESEARSLAYLEENARKDGVVTLESGVQYEVLSTGSGARHPSADSRVTVHYHGTLMDGTVFDSSVDRGEPATFPLNRVIPGFRDALTHMTEGDHWRVTIPPAQAYGERAPGNIGPNAALVFELELLEIEQGS